MEKNDLEAVISTLRQTDQYYYQMGVSSRQSKNYEESNQYLAEMVDRFPQSSLIAHAKSMIKGNEAKIRERAEADLKRNQEAEKSRLRRGGDLELLDWNWSSSHGYVTAKGQVENISDKSLRNVEAVVTFDDKDGGFITSSSALIEFNPILPGQTSPFSVTETHNPAMKKASIQFKFLMGGTISTYREKK